MEKILQFFFQTEENKDNSVPMQPMCKDMRNWCWLFEKMRFG